MPLLTTKTKIALLRLAQWPTLKLRRAFGCGSEVTVTRRKLRWHLDLEEGIDFAIFIFGAFELGTQAAYRRFVEPGAVVLDIGGNVGAHTLPLAALVGPAGKLIAFEPTAWAYDKLQKNIALNSSLAGCVVAEQMMLVESAGDALPKEIMASWPVGPTPGEVHPLARGRHVSTKGAATESLDGYLARHAVTRVDFVKMDVDGYECAVLSGAAKMLRELRPAIVMELAPYLLEGKGESLGRLLAILSAAGYGLVDERHGRVLPMEEKWLQAWVPPGASRNVFALPEECIDAV